MTVQELSIQWIDFHRTGRFVKWNDRKMAKKPLVKIIDRMVSAFNKSHVEEKEKFEHRPTHFKKKCDFERRVFAKVVVITPSLAGKINKKLEGKKLPEQKPNTDILIFFYRDLPQREIAAVTSRHAWCAVRSCIDYEFPTRIAERILDPMKIVEITKTSLIGPAIRQKISHPAKGELYKTATLYNLVESFTCQIKEHASILAICPRIIGRNIRINTGLFRIMFRLPLEDYPRLLDLFSEYVQGGKTYNARGIEEVADPQFEFLHFLQPAEVYSGRLNAALVKKILFQWNNKPEMTISLRHKFLNEFLNGIDFELQITSGERYFPLSSTTPTLDDILSKLESEEKNLGDVLKRGKLRYISQDRKEINDLIINCLEGELHYEGENYFKIRGMWYQLTADYTALLHEDFLRLVRNVLIPTTDAAQLPRPWRGNDGRGNVTQKSVNEVLKMPGIRKFMKALSKATVCYIDEANEVTQERLSGEILRIPNIRANREAIEAELQATDSPLPVDWRIEDNFGEETLKELKTQRPVLRKKSKKQFVANPSAYPLRKLLPTQNNTAYEDFTKFLEEQYEKSENVEDEETYNRSYLYDTTNDGKPFGPKSGFLVLDQICPRNIELCDVVKYTELETFLYTVKGNFGKETREACSQTLNAAKELRSALSIHSGDFLHSLWDMATKGEHEGWRGKVQTQLKALGIKNFLNLFHNRKIVFVYAFLEKEGRSIHSELKKRPAIHSSHIPFDRKEEIFQALVKAEYLDSKGRLTGKFLDSNMKTFVLNGFEEESEEIFRTLSSFKSFSESTLAKLELLHLEQELRLLNFEFRICEIRRAGDSSSLPLSEETSPLESESMEIDEEESPMEEVRAFANRPIQLKNIINSCYINATLQLLFNIPSVCESIGEKRNDKLIHPLSQIFNKKEVQKNLGFLRDRVFKTKGPTILTGSKYAQHDAHEFMVYILNKLQWLPFETFSRFRFILPNGKFVYTRSESDGGTHHISIPLMKGGFQTVLDTYFSFEKINKPKTISVHGQEKTFTSYGKGLRIGEPPPFLIVHLKRFDNNFNKILTPVAFPEDGLVTLNLGSKQILYSITGFVNHHGKELAVGHYTTDVKKICEVEGEEEEIWFHCDDEVVFDAPPVNPAEDAYIVLLSIEPNQNTE